MPKSAEETTDETDAEVEPLSDPVDPPADDETDENIPGEGHPANKRFELHKIAVHVDEAGQVMNFLAQLAHNSGDSAKAAGMVTDAETLQRVARMFQAIADQQPRKKGKLPSDGDDYTPDDEEEDTEEA